MVMAAGCSFEVSPGASGGGANEVDAGVDAAVVVDSPPDPEAAPLPLFAASNQMLHELDLDAHTTHLVGPIKQGTSAPIDVDGLALHGTMLLGLTPGGSELITIDPATAAVTARRSLTGASSLGGLTVAPAGEIQTDAIVFAGSGDRLVRINATTGAVTTVGLWGEGMTFFSDLAWVKGVGLFATLQGGPCFDVCFARINPSTGTATVFRSNLTGGGANLFGLSGYRDQLWALNGAGPVLSVNQTSGLMTLEFDPLIQWTEAAQ
jgi:hypothetical protein